MHVHDFDFGVVFEVFAEFCDEDVHRAGVEVAVVAPDLLEGVFALEDLILVLAEHAEQVGLPARDALDFGGVLELPVGEVECELADLKDLFVRGDGGRLCVLWR